MTIYYCKQHDRMLFDAMCCREALDAGWMVAKDKSPVGS